MDWRSNKIRIVVQRVSKASVTVDNKKISNIDKGLLLLVGITHTDGKDEVEYLAKKVCNLRVFEDENKKLNLSIKDVKGKLLIVSQFTLYGDCNSGNRPSFTEAAKQDKANELYEYFCRKCKEQGVEVQTGIFGADMKVELINDGPVTIILEK